MIADLPDDFRRSCHWRLYAGAIAGDEGLPSGERPPGVTGADALAYARQAVELDRIRRELYPEGD